MAPHDARNSPGFDPARLSGARLDRLKACAAKAAATFPPPYTHQPYEGPLSTEAGDRMLQRGRWANAHRAKAPKDSGSTGHFGPGWPTAAELDSELGGPDGFFTLCGLHYCNLFANPRMVTLFDTRDADTAVSAMDHGKRIASTILVRHSGVCSRATSSDTAASHPGQPSVRPYFTNSLPLLM